MANAIKLLNSSIDELEIGWFFRLRFSGSNAVCESGEMTSWSSIKVKAHEVGVVGDLAAELEELVPQVGKVKHL